MAIVFDNIITEKGATFIKNQKMFFVSSAPLSADGLVNLSPKGMDTFRILNDTEVAYLDYTGSGVETIAHLKENKRITIMFCAFDGVPNIFRIQGEGTAIEKNHPKFEELYKLFDKNPAVRAVIKVKAKRVSDSCGYGVPYYEYKGDRETLKDWGNSKGESGVLEYQQKKNHESLDGLKGLN